MRTLMIVEDEKMIRQGITAMVRRSGVPVERIIECKNGLEALEMMEKIQADGVITDIKMPKMDGIELVRCLCRMESPPQIAVISGYDDFSYAVEMMKNGAVDYILKPVKRERIAEVIRKMEERITIEHGHRLDGRRAFLHQMKSVMAGERLPECERHSFEKRFGEWEEGTYCLLMAGDSLMEALETVERNEAAEGESTGTGREQVLAVENIAGQNVLVCREADALYLLERLPGEEGVGASAVHAGAGELKDAFGEAEKARKRAFVRGCVCRPKGSPDRVDNKIPDHLCEQFVQRFSTDKGDKPYKELSEIYYMGKHGRVDAEELVAFIRRLHKRLKEHYPNIIRGELDPLDCRNLDAFAEAQGLWLAQNRSSLKERMEVDRNREKIYRAIEFIKQNYGGNINMAMASNHVSMNYTLFSIAFKECTGVNFVNYLKTIRINEAKHLLKETDARILEISRKVGYENEKHFMKTFKAICGVSPSEYRRGVRNGQCRDTGILV